MPMLLDAAFILLLAFHPETGVQEGGTSTEVRSDDLDTTVAYAMLVQSLLEVLGFTVAYVMDGAVASGAA